MSGEVPSSAQESVDDAPEVLAETESQTQAPIGNTSVDETTSQKNVGTEDSAKEVLSNLAGNDVEVVATETGVPADNEARLQQLEKEHETLRSQYMRIAADFDNFRKRQSRDQDDLRLQLTCSTLSEILPVVDNFERARQQLDPQGEEAQALHRSYQGLYKQLVDVLKQLGVAPMRVVGQVFDPTLHEAVLREPSEEQVEDVVVAEMQRGYHLNGRVLRHALVKVSMGPGPQSKTSEESLENSAELDTSQDADSPSKEF